MANIVILLREYYPSFGPTGNCMHNIIKELSKEHSITVIASKTSWQMNKNDSIENINIKRIEDFKSCYSDWKSLNNQHVHNAIKKFVNKISDIFVRNYFRATNILRIQTIHKNTVTRYWKELIALNEICPVDVIIPVGQPYEAGVAACDFVKENEKCKIIPVLFDHLTENDALHRYKIIKKVRYKFNLSIEERILYNSEKIFILPQLKEHYNTHFNTYFKKIIIFEHPLLVRHKVGEKNNQNITNNNSINLVYAGMLDKTHRNPTQILDLMHKVQQDHPLVFNIFHVGNCNQIIESYKHIFGDNLLNHGKVSLHKSFDAMDKANILINIGVISGNQISGKIFDYFAFGKPIIHFYFFDQDPNLKYLKNYPMALCVKLTDKLADENINKINEFISAFQGKQIDFDEVKNIYYDATPQYTANKINELVGGI